ncbi:MAG: electron transport complex subunit RsxA [Acidobacteria bacterium]|nr:electron transport complex subunit RsxA [Acidobacteriota bacterium]
MEKLLLLIVSAVFVNNFVLARFLGICPFLGVSKRISTAAGMSGAVMFVMTLAAMVTWVLQHFVLNPLQIGYLQTIVFILVIASLVQLVELALAKFSPTLQAALGIYLPLITTNCAVLGMAVLNIQNDHSFLETTVFALSAGAGFGLALLIFAGMRERLDLALVPEPMKGTGLALVTAALLSLAFMGFAGLFGSS